jgi:signal transduction histidine kinase
VREDLFLESSDHLVDFVRDVRHSWNPTWGSFTEELDDAMFESIGDGLLSFLWIDRDRRLLTKSPTVRHIDRFFDFFPRARLLILVRDGRSVAQSCMATFGWEFERAARSWAAAADEIDRFIETARAGRRDRFRVVRYEDLVRDLRTALGSILAFLDLDELAFDYDAAAELPVRGSSAYFGRGRNAVHWDPVPRGTDFDPIERWRDWDAERVERFDWIAGEQLRSLGYASHGSGRSLAASSAVHRARDAAWNTRVAINRLIFLVRVRVGTATRPIRERLGIARKRVD